MLVLQFVLLLDAQVVPRVMPQLVLHHQLHHLNIISWCRARSFFLLLLDRRGSAVSTSGVKLLSTSMIIIIGDCSSGMPERASFHKVIRILLEVRWRKRLLCLLCKGFLLKDLQENFQSTTIIRSRRLKLFITEVIF